jgi:hypothetical protein
MPGLLDVLDARGLQPRIALEPVRRIGVIDARRVDAVEQEVVLRQAGGIHGDRREKPNRLDHARANKASRVKSRPFSGSSLTRRLSIVLLISGVTALMAGGGARLSLRDGDGRAGQRANGRVGHRLFDQSVRRLAGRRSTDQEQECPDRR